MSYYQNKPAVYKYPFVKDVSLFTQHSERFSFKNSFDKLTLRFDGACTPVNPYGDMGYGWAIFDQEDIIAHGYGHLYQNEKHQTSNNIAEWAALYFGVEYFLAMNLKYNHLQIIGDSKFVIHQCTYIWKINQEKPYTYIAELFEKELKPLLPKKTWYTWQGRDNNEYCDTLSNKFLGSESYSFTNCSKCNDYGECLEIQGQYLCPDCYPEGS